jgi:hypothetical protein
MELLPLLQTIESPDKLIRDSACRVLDSIDTSKLLDALLQAMLEA